MFHNCPKKPTSPSAACWDELGKEAPELLSLGVPSSSASSDVVSSGTSPSECDASEATISLLPDDAGTAALELGEDPPEESPVASMEDVLWAASDVDDVDDGGSVTPVVGVTSLVDVDNADNVVWCSMGGGEEDDSPVGIGPLTAEKYKVLEDDSGLEAPSVDDELASADISPPSMGWGRAAGADALELEEGVDGKVAESSAAARGKVELLSLSGNSSESKVPVAPSV
jgi:hypothetical protein